MDFSELSNIKYIKTSEYTKLDFRFMMHPLLNPVDVKNTIWYYLMWKVKFTDVMGPLEIKPYPRHPETEETPNSWGVRRDVGKTFLASRISFANPFPSKMRGLLPSQMLMHITFHTIFPY